MIDRPIRRPQTDLRQGLDLLNRIDEFDLGTRRCQRSATTCSNGSGNRPHPRWISDPLARRLPQRFQSLVSPTGCPVGAGGLRCAECCRKPSGSATWPTRGSTAAVAPDLRQTDRLDAARRRADRQSDLIHALRLFDWTVVRNLQLEQILQDGRQRFDSDLILQCWESLLMGRGTLEEKSRVFMLLARQLGVTVVMLGMDSADASRAQPTLAARGAAGRPAVPVGYAAGSADLGRTASRSPRWSRCWINPSCSNGWRSRRSEPYRARTGGARRRWWPWWTPRRGLVAADESP